MSHRLTDTIGAPCVRLSGDQTHNRLFTERSSVQTSTVARSEWGPFCSESIISHSQLRSLALTNILFNKCVQSKTLRLAAYKYADGKKIDGRRVLVDVERGRTVKGWLPRRLGKSACRMRFVHFNRKSSSTNSFLTTKTGGGLGGGRRNAADDRQAAGREENGRDRREFSEDRSSRNYRDDRDRDRKRKHRSRSRSRDRRDKRRRSRD